MTSTRPHVPFTGDILPLFLVGPASPAASSVFLGTSFLMGPHLLITCRHCIPASLPDRHSVIVMVKDGPGRYSPRYLDNVEGDLEGADLATANVDLVPTLPIELPPNGEPPGSGVFSIGYPLTSRIGRDTFRLDTRYLQGYITSDAPYDHPTRGPIPSYEVDMPTPGGLSGAPLFHAGAGAAVVGVIYGTNDVARAEEISRVDERTGERTPELQRIVSFGLAHHTSSLRKVRGAATNGLPLHEYLARMQR